MRGEDRDTKGERSSRGAKDGNKALGASSTTHGEDQGSTDDRSSRRPRRIKGREGNTPIAPRARIQSMPLSRTGLQDVFVREGRGDGEAVRVSCDAYLDPSLVLGVAVISRLAAAVDGLSLAGGSQVISARDGWSLPLLHLDQGRWMRRGRGRRGGNRHMSRDGETREKDQKGKKGGEKE